MSSSNLINRYLYTLGTYLPESSKEDILKEVETNIYDSLEQQTPEEGQVNDQAIEAALRAMGHPRKLALEYAPDHQVLFPAKYLDTYWLVIQIVFIAFALASAIGHFISSRVLGNPGLLVSTIVGSLWQSAISAVGVVTIIFLIIGKVSRETVGKAQSPLRSEQDQWSLDDLKDAPSKANQISRIEIAIESFFMLFGLAWLLQLLPTTFVSDRVQIFWFDVSWIQPYIPYLSGLLILSLVVNVILLVLGQWHKFTRWATLGINLGFIIMAFLLFGTLDGSIHRGILVGIRIGIAAVVIISVFDSVGHVRTLVRRDNRI
jgi:hypothetical protein